MLIHASNDAATKNPEALCNVNNEFALIGIGVEVELSNSRVALVSIEDAFALAGIQTTLSSLHSSVGAMAASICSFQGSFWLWYRIWG